MVKAPIPYTRVAIAAFAGGGIGLASVLGPMGEMDDFLPLLPVYGSISALLWIALAKAIRNRNAWTAIAVGLLSPIAACLLAAPLLVGIGWAIYLGKTWYFTFPIGAGMGLVIHGIVNVFNPAASRARSNPS